MEVDSLVIHLTSFLLVTWASSVLIPASCPAWSSLFPCLAPWGPSPRTSSPCRVTPSRCWGTWPTWHLTWPQPRPCRMGPSCRGWRCQGYSRTWFLEQVINRSLTQVGAQYILLLFHLFVLKKQNTIQLIEMNNVKKFPFNLNIDFYFQVESVTMVVICPIRWFGDTTKTLKMNIVLIKITPMTNLILFMMIRRWTEIVVNITSTNWRKLFLTMSTIIWRSEKLQFMCVIFLIRALSS